MTNLYLVRHGQAGTRDAYDSLSPLGIQQARLLGEHFLSQRIRFAAAYAGSLRRQQQTAEQVSAAYAAAGVLFPAIRVDPGWDEFDLGHLYRELAPRLCEEDPEFRAEYEKMCELVRLSNGEPGARIHRKWQPCDTKVVDAWISGRYPFSGETWDNFRERVAACRLKMRDAEGHEKVLVVTSASPVAIWTALALEIVDERIMRLAGVLFNASYTVLRLQDERLRLYTFNAVPHFAVPALRTHR